MERLNTLQIKLTNYFQEEDALLLKKEPFKPDIEKTQNLLNRFSADLNLKIPPLIFKAFKIASA